MSESFLTKKDVIDTVHQELEKYEKEREAKEKETHENKEIKKRIDKWKGGKK